MARSAVARKLVGLGGQPVYRHDFVTDNGNVILDVHGLDMSNPTKVEDAINGLPGVLLKVYLPNVRPTFCWWREKAVM